MWQFFIGLFFGTSIGFVTAGLFFSLRQREKAFSEHKDKREKMVLEVSDKKTI